MPELPEVETIRRDLLAQVVGSRFVRVALLWPGIVHQPSPEEFCRRLIGQEVRDVRRRGKYLLLSLSGEETLVLHFGMTGVLRLESDSADAGRYARAVLYLDGGRELHFCDQRKWGVMWLVKDVEEVVGKLGVEPLDAEFTPEVMGTLFGRRTAPIKALLMEQGLIAGIGNMYADEALFAARIHPLKKGKDLSGAEMERLHRAIRQVLQAAIGHRGASVDTYRGLDGEPGVAQDFFKAAHRDGETCSDCGSPIERIVVRGRGTCFCPCCQRE